MFEWDENKRLSNLDKHGLDFRDAWMVFDGRPFVEIPSAFEMEMRFLRTGISSGRIVTVVWTARNEKRRVISFRSARDDEKRAYRELHGRGT
jgi:uncharacterized DUF497 family protein